METRKVLAQANPLATTLTDLYTAGAGIQVVCSSVVVCNRGAATTFRLSVAAAGAADDLSQYLFYDTAIGANSTVTVIIGITLGPTDEVRVYAGAATLSFNMFGVELS